jgi:tetratricopeptide (TPR) repeat protein
MLELTSPHLDDFTLLRYVAEDLDDTEKRAAVAHLRACEACQATIGEIEELDQELRAVADNTDTRRDFTLEDLPEGDPFRRRPRATLRIPRRTGESPDAVASALAGSEEGTALSCLILDVLNSSANELEAILVRLDLSDIAHRFALLYVLQSAGSAIAQSPVRALRLAEQALDRIFLFRADKAEPIGETAVPGSALLGLAHQLAGQACLWTGELERSKSHLEVAYRAMATTGDEIGLANIEFLESQRRYFGGKAEESLNLARRAASTFEALGISESLARAEHAVGYALKALGRHEEALSAFRSAASFFKDNSVWSNYVAAVNSLATLLKEMGRLEEARREYAAALRRLSGREHRSHLALIRQGLGELLLASGRPREAALSLSRAARLFGDCGMISFALMAALVEVECWARAGDTARALHRLGLFQAEVNRRGVLDPSISRRIEEALSGSRPDFEKLAELKSHAKKALENQLGLASA